MIYCEECSSKHKVEFVEEYGLHLCSNCIKMNEEHPVNHIPPMGEIHFDSENRPICHICGRAYNKLMSHTRQKHDVSALEYKKMFGLHTSKGIVAKHTAELLRAHVDKNYDIVVEGNLKKNGKKTRFKNGYEGRTKDKLSLQALKQLQNRKKEEEEE